MGRPPFELPVGMRAALLESQSSGPDYNVIDCPGGVVIRDEIMNDDGTVSVKELIIAGMHLVVRQQSDGQLRSTICRVCRGYAKVVVPRTVKLQVLDLTELHRQLDELAAARKSAA